MELVKTGTQCKQTVIPYPISGMETLGERTRCKQKRHDNNNNSNKYNNDYNKNNDNSI